MPKNPKLIIAITVGANVILFGAIGFLISLFLH